MRIRTSTRVLGFVAIATSSLALMCAIAAGAAAPPSLKIVTPSSTIAQWDTMAGVTATPRTLDGTIAASSPITWSSTPSGMVSVLASANGHTVALVGLTQGTAHVVASWKTFSGKTHVVAGIVQVDVVTLQDSLIVTVNPPTITMTPFNVVANGVPSFDPTLSPFCLYAMATDRRGTIYTGMRATWSSNDAWLADALSHVPCSDTTVNPRLLPSPLPRP